MSDTYDKFGVRIYSSVAKLARLIVWLLIVVLLTILMLASLEG